MRFLANANFFQVPKVGSFTKIQSIVLSSSVLDKKEISLDIACGIEIVQIRLYKGLGTIICSHLVGITKDHRGAELMLFMYFVNNKFSLPMYVFSFWIDVSKDRREMCLMGSTNQVDPSCIYFRIS